MKAVIINQAGGHGVLNLADIEQPEIVNENQVLVRLKTVGMNPVDTKVRNNPERFPVSMPAVLSCDGAGIVEAIGSSVTNFRPGDEAYFFQCGFGEHIANYAEYAMVDEGLLAAKPKSLDFQQAAAATLVLITAREALHDRTDVQADQTILIPGAIPRCSPLSGKRCADGENCIGNCLKLVNANNNS